MHCQDNFLSNLDSMLEEYTFLVQLAFAGWISCVSVLEGEGAVAGCPFLGSKVHIYGQWSTWARPHAG